MSRLNSLWSESEDSFLRHFCTIQRNSVSDFYYWDRGLVWPKFTFLRLKSFQGLTLDQFNKEIADFRQFSNTEYENVVVKINDEYVIPPEIKNRLQATGSRLSYLAFYTANKAVDLDCELIQVRDLDGLKIFWTVNSSGRERARPFDSPLWPVIVKSFHSGTQYFYLMHKGVAVSCGAIDNLNAGYNLWGLATLDVHKNQGYMSLLILKLIERLKAVFVGQVNYGGLTHQYFLKHCASRELATETWYSLIPK